MTEGIGWYHYLVVMTIKKVLLQCATTLWRRNQVTVFSWRLLYCWEQNNFPEKSEGFLFSLIFAQQPVNPIILFIYLFIMLKNYTSEIKCWAGEWWGELSGRERWFWKSAGSWEALWCCPWIETWEIRVHGQGTATGSIREQLWHKPYNEVNPFQKPSCLFPLAPVE